MTSTHNIPITMLSSFVGKAVVKLVAIQPKCLDVGEELSIEMKERFDGVCEKVKDLLNN